MKPSPLHNSEIMNTTSRSRILPGPCIRALAGILTVLGITSSAFAVERVWDNTGTTWNTGSSWVGDTAPTNSTATDTTLFTNTGAGNNSVGFTSDRRINAVTFSATANSYTFENNGFSLDIGSGGIVHSAANLQTINTPLLVGANQAWTTVSGGTLTVAGLSLSDSATARVLTIGGAGDANLGAIQNGLAASGTLSVTSTGVTTLTGSNTFAGALTMNASAGTLVVNGDNSASDASVTVTAGKLRIGSTSALGSTVGGTTVASGGELDLNGQTVGAEALGLSGTGVSGLGALQNTSATAASVSGAVTLNANTTIGAASGNITLSGNIGESGSRNLTKVGAGILTLQGNINYTGSTTVNEGSLVLSGSNSYAGNTNIGASGRLSATSAAALSTNSILFTGTSLANSTELNLAAADAGYAMNSLSLGGILYTTGPGAGSATVMFNNGGVQTGTTGKEINAGLNTTVVMGSAGPTTYFDIVGSSASGDRSLRVNGGGNVVFNSILRNNASGGAAAFVGGLDIRPTFSGVATLNALNTYTGITTVGAGTLLVSSTGSINSTSGVTVAGGAKFVYNGSSALTPAVTLSGNGSSSRAVLSGSGSIDSALTLNNLGDVLSPGNSPGELSFDQAQSWNSFSYDWEINNFVGTVGGTDFDLISISGGLTLTGGNGDYILNLLSLTAGNVAGPVANFSETEISWTILTASGGITGFDAADWTIDDSAFSSSPSYTGSFSLSQSGNNLVLAYAVPEPGTAGIFALSIGFFLLHNRLRVRRAARSNEA